MPVPSSIPDTAPRSIPGTPSERRRPAVAVVAAELPGLQCRRVWDRLPSKKKTRVQEGKRRWFVLRR